MLFAAGRKGMISRQRIGFAGPEELRRAGAETLKHTRSPLTGGNCSGPRAGEEFLSKEMVTIRLANKDGKGVIEIAWGKMRLTGSFAPAK
jgi:hypothetical protein